MSRAAHAGLRFRLAVLSRLAKLRTQQGQTGGLVTAEVHLRLAELVLGVDTRQGRNSLNITRPGWVSNESAVWPARPRRWPGD
jgi:hypothetical protein